MRVITLTAMLLLMMLFTTANAEATQRLNGNALMSMLDAYNQKPNDNFDAGFFAGYVSGVTETLNGVIWCTTGNLPLEQLLSIVSKYLDQHPEQWHMSAQYIISIALAEAYPCQPGQ